MTTATWITIALLTPFWWGLTGSDVRRNIASRVTAGLPPPGDRFGSARLTTCCDRPWMPPVVAGGLGAHLSSWCAV
jgi:hypothetical protein